MLRLYMKPRSCTGLGSALPPATAARESEEGLAVAPRVADGAPGELAIVVVGQEHDPDSVRVDRADVAIKQWAQERPDLPSLPMAVLGRLSEASERAMRDHLNPLFAEAGLQPGEFDVLATLRR
jgi:hypothetical protein